MTNLALDLQQLRAFFTVVQAGSFSGAARRLHRTQSAVSHAVRKLEDSAQVRLLDRLGREVRLTEEGRTLHNACESIFSTLEAAQDDLRQGPARARGRLRLGATVEFGSSILMRNIRPFIDAYPDVEMDLYLSHDLLTPLLREDVDLAIDCVHYRLPQLERTPLFREEYMVACSPSYRETKRIHNPSDLSRCVILSLDKECAWWRRFLTTFPVKSQPRFGRVIEINHIRGMINAAASSLGVLIVPSYSIQSELGRGILVPLFPSIRLLEDRFALYQKAAKANLFKHRILKQYLQNLKLSELSGIGG